MAISVFDLFKIGIGPSSSHTVGPMRAAAMFVASLESAGMLGKVTSVRAELYGSLGATGHGHGSMPAIVLGLRGEHPETVDPSSTSVVIDSVRESGKLTLGEAGGSATQEIDFDVDEDVVLHRRKRLPFHSNAMVFTAADASGGELTPADVLLGRRRLRSQRGPGARASAGAGFGAGAVPVQQRRRVAGTRQGERAIDQRRDARERTGEARGVLP